MQLQFDHVAVQLEREGIGTLRPEPIRRHAGS